MTIKRVFAILLIPYAIWLVSSYEYHFLDGVNLLIHEGGHVIFSFFGEWMHFLGGTLLQLFIPGVIAFHFLLRHHKYEAAFCFLWFGESMMYTGEYLGDAQAQKLPLVGGGTHDWNWMLSRLDILEQCESIALFVHVIASIVVVGCIGYLLFESFRFSKNVNPKLLDKITVSSKYPRRYVK